MAFLTVGLYDIPVEADQFEQLEDERGGNAKRAFAMNLLRSFRTPKRSWRFRTAWLTEADYQTLRANITATGDYTVSGDFLGGLTPPLCAVTINSSPYISFGGTGWRRQVTFTIREL